MSVHPVQLLADFVLLKSKVIVTKMTQLLEVAIMSDAI